MRARRGRGEKGVEEGGGGRRGRGDEGVDEEGMRA